MAAAMTTTQTVRRMIVCASCALPTGEFYEEGTVPVGIDVYCEPCRNLPLPWHVEGVKTVIDRTRRQNTGLPDAAVTDRYGTYQVDERRRMLYDGATAPTLVPYMDEPENEEEYEEYEEYAEVCCAGCQGTRFEYVETCDTIKVYGAVDTAQYDYRNDDDHTDTTIYNVTDRGVYDHHEGVTDGYLRCEGCEERYDGPYEV